MAPSTCDTGNSSPPGPRANASLVLPRALEPGTPGLPTAWQRGHEIKASEGDLWLGIKGAGRREGIPTGNDPRKRPVTLLSQAETIKQRHFSVLEKEVSLWKRSPCALAEGREEEEDWPLATH